MAASDEAKANRGGEVAVGDAVATSGGALPCGVVHAVAMGYRTDGSRILATPSTVRTAFARGLLAAAQAGHTTVVTKVMCARQGYSTVQPPSDAPRVMLEAMLHATVDAQTCGLHQVVIYVPRSYALLRETTVRIQLPHGDTDVSRILANKND